MSLLALVAGAGAGTRLGSPGPKALVKLGGESLLVHALRGLDESGAADGAIVMAPPDACDEFRRVAASAGYTEAGPFPVQIVAGGATRQASVANGLAAAGDAQYVLVHDAARALTPPVMIRRVASALEAGHVAVVPALPVVDTVKEVSGAVADGAELVARTLDRSRLRAVQTPQGFEVAALRAAHAALAAGASDEASAASDDAALMEALGYEVTIVEGDERALKITRPLDVVLAQALLAGGDSHTTAG